MMKHKAQESLNNLKEYDDDYSSLELQFAENIDCYDIEPTYENQKEIDNIQDLINCQLPPEEIEFILDIMKCKNLESKYTIDEICDFSYRIKGHLNQQKEMWE